MKYYLDTEFNQEGGQLLSLALINEHGPGIYIKVKIMEELHPWVRENVLPHLNEHKANVVYDRDDEKEVGQILRDTLVSMGDDDVTIIADSPVDIMRFCKAFTVNAGGVYMNNPLPRITFIVENVDSYPTDLPGAVRHSAWWDAAALKYKLEGK